MNGAAGLSLAQQSLWFLHRLAPSSTAAFNVRAALRLQGPLQPGVLTAALQAVVDRHEELRAYVALSDDQPARSIASAVRCDIPVVDLTSVEPSARDRERQRVIDAEGRHVFDLGAAPLFRCRLCRTAADDWFLVLTAHHIIADAWSLAVILRDLSAAYRRLTIAPELRLPVPSHSYADFVDWQRRRLASPHAGQDLEFWTSALAGLEPLRLPADLSSRGATYEGESRQFVIPPETTESLREISRQSKATLFHTLLAAYSIFLSRLTGQTDFTVGTSVAGRDDESFEPLVGFFADLLVVRQDLSGRPTFVDVIDRVRRRSLDALDHQHAPFDAILREISPGRTGDAALLFHAMFLFTKNPAAQFDVPGLTVSAPLLPSVTAKYPLSLHIEDDGESLRGLIECRTALFSSRRIDQLHRHWLHLITGLARQPSASVAAVAMLDRAEEHRVTLGRNAPGTPSSATTLHERFSRQAETQAARTAVSDAHGDVTYGELEARANQIAWRLREMGVRPETRVGLCLGRSADAIVALLAVVKAGGAYVPLDPAYPTTRLGYLIADANIEIVVTRREDASAVPASANLRILDLDAVGALLPDAPPLGAPPVSCQPDNAAYVIYTSGSTGQPKGVVVTHGNATRLFQATTEWFRFGPDDVWVLFHSLSFDFSVWEVWGALLHGGRLVVAPYLTTRSPEAFRRLLVDERVTVLNQTPSAFRQLIDADRSASGPADFSLRWIVFGGEALDPAMLRPWVERYGEARPQLANMYGITETTVHVTFRPLSSADVFGEPRSAIGERIPDLELYVLDRAQRPVPEGVTGELFVGGAGVARGYLGRAALTAERFVPNPYGRRGSRLYRTGDLARWLDNGDLEYLGRADGQIKIRGFRVEPFEIEEVVRRHDAVRDAVIDLRGRGDGARLVAYVIPAPGRTPAPADLHTWCVARLPAHMVPAVFVSVASWPMTVNGKLDRTALPAPDDGALVHRGEEEPKTEAERAIAKVWAGVLGLARVNRDDNFFELGGDSILCLRVLSGLRRHGLMCSLADLYRCGSVRELAAIATPGGDHVPAVAPFALINSDDRGQLPPGVVDAYPLTRLQRGMLFHRELAPGTAVYHDVFSVQLRLPWNPAAFTTVVQQLAEAHAALRTSVDSGTFSQPLQLVHHTARVSCTFADLSAHDTDAQNAEVARVVADEQATEFNLSAPPLCRFHMVRRSGGAVQIVFGFHHVILDGWSVASLMTSLIEAYRALCQGQALEHPDTPGPGVAVAREQEALGAEDSRRFWQSEPLPVMELPRHPPASSEPDARRSVARLTVPLSAALSAGLHEIAARAHTHVKSVLLAAHLLVLSRLAGQPDAVTGLVMNTRPETDDGERILGLFLNTVPFHVDVSTPTFVELVRRVAAREQTLLVHRHFPMHEIRQIRGGRALFDAAFNFIHFHVYRQLLRPGGLEVIGHEFLEETDFPFLAQFAVYPDGTSIELQLTYAAREFSAAYVRRIASSYERVLEAAVARPQAAPSTYALISSSEAADVLSWRGQGQTYPEAPSLPAWFSTVAARHGDAVAITSADGTLTYAAFDRQSTQMAHALRRLGVGPETRVGLAMERTPSLLVGLLAILKAGGAYVPLDPAYPPARRRFMLDDSRVRLVLTDGRVPIPAEIPAFDVSDVAAWQHELTTPIEPAPQPDHPAYVIYTSGSTGQPKGVVVTHRNVTRLFQAAAAHFTFGPSDVWTLFHSIAFDFSVWELWGAWLYGGRLVLVDYETSRTPERFYGLLADEGVTVLNQTPSAFRQLLGVDDTQRRPLALRYMIFGGEALDLALLAPWVERHGDAAPALVNMYGITETTVHVTHRRIRRADVLGGAGSLIGQPLGDLQLYVLDRHQQLVASGLPGELYVGGEGLARGYLAQPAMTASRFGPNPFGAGRLYRTGDAARWLDGGELEYLGRLDDQVKIRGFRIELGEIASVLREHGGLREAAVIARRQPSGEPQLIAYGIAAGLPAPTAASLRIAAQQWLPAHMVPAAFVLLDALPLTRHGKLDRDALPAPESDAGTVDFVPPRSDVERQLCAIWQELFTGTRIGITHNFFDLGGHSLLATQLIARVRHRLGVDLPFRVIFDAPTIQAMAARVSASSAAPAPQPARSTPRAPRQRRQVAVTSDGTLLPGDSEPTGR